MPWKGSFFDKSSHLKFLKRLIELSLGIHDYWTSPRDRFMQGFGHEKEETHPFFIGSESECLTIFKQHRMFGCDSFLTIFKRRAPFEYIDKNGSSELRRDGTDIICCLLYTSISNFFSAPMPPIQTRQSIIFVNDLGFPSLKILLCGRPMSRKRKNNFSW